jgi:nicotinamidase/pyrazinamidase
MVQTLFWNVDTQVDFIEPTGKLYAPGAEMIKPVLKKITEYAKKHHIKVVNTCDYHNPDSAELSQNPDFISTFPQHCMAGTSGAEYIPETQPENPFVVDWTADQRRIEELKQQNPRNIVIRKDAFDVFSGNPYTEAILQLIKPDRVFVYGVTTNVCVDQAVMGLSNRGLRVHVLQDAIRELPNIPLPFEKWSSRGIILINSRDLDQYVEEKA